MSWNDYILGYLGYFSIAAGSNLGGNLVLSAMRVVSGWSLFLVVCLLSPLSLNAVRLRVSLDTNFQVGHTRPRPQRLSAYEFAAFIHDVRTRFDLQSMDITVVDSARRPVTSLEPLRDGDRLTILATETPPGYESAIESTPTRVRIRELPTPTPTPTDRYVLYSEEGSSRIEQDMHSCGNCWHHSPLRSS